MKTFINTLSNTYKALKLLSNPAATAYIEHQLKTARDTMHSTKTDIQQHLGKNDAYFHKHYIVHVMN